VLDILAMMIPRYLALFLFCVCAAAQSAVTCPPLPADCLVHAGETATIPDTPEPQAIGPATFWTFEGDAGHEPPIRSNREAFHDKTWLIAQGVWLGPIMFDVEATHQGIAHHRCVEGNDGSNHYPTRAELYRGSIPEYVVGTAWNYMSLRLLTKSLIFIFPAMSGTTHLVAGTRWLTDCW
jgi:hypothetical protein